MTFANPPIMVHVLLEDPVLLLAALLLLGVIFLIVAYRRRLRRPAVVGLVSLVMAAVLWTVAAAVKTQRERLILRCEELVQATAPLDGQRLADMFETQTVLRGPDGREWLRGGPELLRRLETVAQRVKIEPHERVQIVAQLAIDVDTDGNRHGQTVLALRTPMPSEFSMPPRTTWVIIWRVGQDHRWRMMDVQWKKLNGVPPPMGVW